MDNPHAPFDAIAPGLPQPGPKVTTSAQVAELLHSAFDCARTARSAAYKEGVAAQLRLMLQRERLLCPYPPGSGEFDAFFAGAGEGAAIARLYLESLA